MARRKKNKIIFVMSWDQVLTLALLLGLLVFIKHPLLGILLALCCCGIFIYKKWQRQELLRALEINDVDIMSGHEFEHYVASLLAHQGYRVKVTRASGDNGVDVIAHRDGVGWAVQCKRQVTKVARNAISDAVAATNSSLFNCSRSMVVTNSYFSSAAIEYAKSTNCLLVDRTTLGQWILAIKN